MVTAGTVVPLLGWLGGRRAGREHIQTKAELNASLIDHIQGLGDSLAYGRTESSLKQLDALSTSMADEEMQLARLDGWQTGLMILLTNGAALAVLTVAIPRVDGIYLGTLALATIAAFEAVMPLSQAAHQLGANITAAERIFEIMDTTPAVTDPPHPLPKPDLYPLEIEGLDFGYVADSSPVLKDVNLRLEPGTRIALLGASGSGKSTLVNLLVRFWDYESGSIRSGKSRSTRLFDG